MNDFDYDKNGSKSKRCSLPSDRLTEKQLERMNGEVITLNPNKTMSWGYFKALPKHLQEHYLTHLVTEYGAPYSRISEMLGVSKQTLGAFAKLNGLKLPATSRGKRFTPAQESRWNVFCGINPAEKAEAKRAEEGIEEQKPEINEDAVLGVPADESNAFGELTPEIAHLPMETQPCTAPEAAPTQKAEKKMKMLQLSAEFTGAFDADAIANSMRILIQRGQKVAVKITVTNLPVE